VTAHALARVGCRALLGGGAAAALVVGRGGAVDRLRPPRFAGGPCCAAPPAPALRTARRYRPGPPVPATDVETAEGAVALIGCMPLRFGDPRTWHESPGHLHRRSVPDRRMV
jgi:hypothetical protein